MESSIKPRLYVENVCKRYGGLMAVSNISFEVRPAEIFGIIGPNGAGKTTLFNLISGGTPLTTGRIFFDGEEISNCAMNVIARRRIIRTFQSTTVFQRESVRRNLERAFLFSNYGTPGKLISKLDRSKKRNASDLIEEILVFTDLGNVSEELAGQLPYGLQKLLGVAMGLTASPRLMLMDEPAAGLNPAETNSMTALIRKLHREKEIDVVLVEHDMKMVMAICDRILVINHGRVLFTGSPVEVQSHPDVIDAYLGVELDELN